MPFGFSGVQYLTLVGSTLASMLAGASLVHLYYKPDLTIPDQPPPKPESAGPKGGVALVAPRGHRDDSQ
eukprot:m.24557 g.24557  ORF g.24557 m.24557 type:complete len:69 (+) comp4287_c0_seq1:2255-2461(+)